MKYCFAFILGLFLLCTPCLFAEENPPSESVFDLDGFDFERSLVEMYRQNQLIPVKNYPQKLWKAEYSTLVGLPYTLQNLREKGTVCSGRANYACSVSRTLGTPTMRCSSDQKYAEGHYWVQWIEFHEVSPKRIWFTIESCGRDDTGIDLSESQLKRARKKAKAENLIIDFQRHDARNLPFDGEFEAAIMLCEGGFSLMETDEMNFDILKNVTKALKPGAKLIFTTINGLFPLYHNVSEFYESTREEGNSICRNNTFDLMTFRDYNTVEFEDDSGKKMTLECNERYYVPCEITWLLKSLGYRTIDIFGAKLGAFSREHSLTTENFEMLVIASL